MSSRVRILMLHGFTQNANVFRKKSGAFRKKFDDNEVEFVYLDSPHSKGLNKDTNEEERTWWFASDDGKVYDKWEQSVKTVEDLLAKEKIDGILGFSQGAAFGALLCALSQQPDKKDKLPFRFAILCGGFMPRAEALALYCGEQAPLIEKPTLVMSGEADTMVPPDRTKPMLQRFKDPVLLMHKNGHVLDHDNETIAELKKFIAPFRQIESATTTTTTTSTQGGDQPKL